MQKSATRKFGLALLAAVLFGSPGILFAGPVSLSDDSTSTDASKEAPPVEKSWCETPPPWEIRIGVPGWLPGLSGEAGVKGVVSALPDITLDQLLKHLTHFPIALSAEARYQRWEFHVDGVYAEVGTSAELPGLFFTNADVHLKAAYAEGFVGYRLINCDNLSLTLFAGARWTYLLGDLSISDNGDARLAILRQLLGIPGRLDFSGSTDWTDPLLGARGRVELYKGLRFWVEGNVGGFDANSDTAYELRQQGRTIVRSPVDSTDWSYDVAGGLEFQLTRLIWAQAGWRYLKYDYRKAGFTDEIAINGPLIQFGVNF
jgi:hypothetical protein